MSKLLFSLLTICVLATPATSQSISGTPSSNASQPVEATADDLQVSNENNSAVFTGNAHVVQGVLNLKADKITVFFDDAANNIRLVDAIGRVKFTNGTESAEAQTANFDVASQVVSFAGNVLLKQGQTVLSGDRLTYNITTSQSKMSGNVKTVFVPE